MVLHRHSVRYILAVTSVTLVVQNGARAQGEGVNVSKVGTTAAAFLEIPVGGRAIGMGRAFVSTANDISSLYWNPAGLARLPMREATFSQIDWIADMSFNYAGVGIPLGAFGSLGLSFSSLTMDDMLVRTIERPQGTGELFSAGSFAVGVHYARNLSDRFSIGFTGKYISERIWNMQSEGLALDVGVLFTTDFFNGVRIGATISNFGTDMKLAGRDTRQFNRIDDRKMGSNDRVPMNIELDPWPLPLNFQFGIATEVLQSESHVLTVEVDALHPSANYESLNVGFEYGFLNIVSLRAGHHSLFLTDGEGGLSFGAGVTADLFGGNLKAQFDYAYSDFGLFKGINVISVSVLF